MRLKAKLKKQRAQAKKEAAEEAYYKGMEAPKTSFVDTGNGITEVQTNSDKNGPVNEPVQKQTTLQNYKPVQSVEQAKPNAESQEVKPDAATLTEEVAPAETTEIKTPAADTTPDVKVEVPEVDEEMMTWVLN